MNSWGIVHSFLSFSLFIEMLGDSVSRFIAFTVRNVAGPPAPAGDREGRPYGVAGEWESGVC